MNKLQRYEQIIKGLLEIAQPGTTKNSLWVAYQEAKEQREGEAVETLFFTSKEHKARLRTALIQLEKLDQGRPDREYAAALYILAHDAYAWVQAEPYISSRGILFKTLLKGGHSHGYKIMLQLAANLFNPYEYKKFNTGDFETLDEDNYKICMTALHIARYGFHTSDLQGE